MAELTEEQKKELVKKNDVAKKLAESFFKSGVWSWDDPKSCGDISVFAHYNIGYPVKCVKYVEEKKDYGNEGFIIDGAEYRYNLALMRGFGGYKKLDAEAQKLVNKEIFGQETRPSKDSQAFVDGLHKCLEIQRIIGSEYAARPLATDDKSKENQPMNSKPVTEKPANNPMKNDGSTSMILDEDTFYAMFDMPEAPKPTKTLSELGLPESIRNALDAANFKPANISADAPATRLAFKAAVTEGTKKTTQVA
jgi:hypothetical protein